MHGHSGHNFNEEMASFHVEIVTRFLVLLNKVFFIKVQYVKFRKDGIIICKWSSKDLIFFFICANNQCNYGSTYTRKKSLESKIEQMSQKTA